MEVRTIPISQIQVATYNPRADLQPGDPEYEALEMSLEEFGLTVPLVWNEKTGNLVGGHQRLKVLVAKGEVEVEVSVVNLDEMEEKALNLALNRVRGEWDEDKLADLLSDMDPDLQILTGFDDMEIERLLKAPEPVETGGGGSSGPGEDGGSDPLEVENAVFCPGCGHKFDIREGLSGNAR